MLQKTLVCIWIVFFLAGCQTRYSDFSQELSPLEIYSLSSGKFLGIAWINEQTIVVEIDEGSTTNDEGLIINHPKIAVLDIYTHNFEPISIETPCETYSVRSLQVLPNHNAGFLFKCPKTNSQFIKELNESTLQITDRYERSSIDSFFDFAYSPDMEEVVFSNGLYLESNLIHINIDKMKTNITTEFDRASFPVWSPEKNLIAFLGTKPYPGADDVKHFSETVNRLDYPWQLYLYNPLNSEAESLPFDIIHPSSLKWSPDGAMLAFSGEYDGIPGVWIISNFDDPENVSVVRLISELATFDFSPDSKSIVYAYIGLRNSEEQSVLYIAELKLPEENQ